MIHLDWSNVLGLIAPWRVSCSMRRTALVRDESSPCEMPKGENPFGEYLLEHQGGVLVLDESHPTISDILIRKSGSPKWWHCQIYLNQKLMINHQTLGMNYFQTNPCVITVQNCKPKPSEQPHRSNMTWAIMGKCCQYCIPSSNLGWVKLISLGRCFDDWN